MISCRSGVFCKRKIPNNSNSSLLRSARLIPDRFPEDEEPELPGAGVDEPEL